MNVALRGRDLTFGYTSARMCIEAIDVELRAGELLGIIGPNGSGKSTLLKVLLGYLTPHRGAVEVGDRSLRRLSRIERAQRIGLVPQNSSVRMPLTVMETVLLGRYARRTGRFGGFTTEDMTVVHAVLADLGLTGMEERRVTELSGGEFQKVLLARAFVQETGILLLDEATNNLDIRHTIEIMDLIVHKTSTEGCAIAAVVHDLNLAAAYCDKLLVLKEGRVLAYGTVREVVTAENLFATYEVSLPLHFDENGVPFLRIRDTRSGEREGKPYVSV